MYELVIFDIDGTMIDTEQVVRESYSYAMLEELGHPLTDEELSRAYGIPTMQALERLGAKDIDTAASRYFDSLLGAYRAGVPIFNGIIDVLEELKKRGIKCGVVTSRNKDEVSNDKSLRSLLKYFDYLVCAEDTVKHKPDAEPILKLAEMSGTGLSGLLYLGDTLYDYLCAKNAGIEFALALWGARDTEGIRPDHLLEKPADLLRIIESAGKT
jgi:HAD superfamily hydrolase (TIGR01549 family)